MKAGQPGSRAGAVAALKAFAKRMGVGASFVNASGANPKNRSAPREIARLLTKLQRKPYFQALYESFPIAGSTGRSPTG